VAYLTVFEACFLVTKGLPIEVTIYRLCIYRNYSRASCIASYRVGCGQYSWYSKSYGGITGCSCGTYSLVQSIPSLQLFNMCLNLIEALVNSQAVVHKFF